MQVIKGGDPKKDIYYSTHTKFYARAMADIGVTSPFQKVAKI